MAPLGWMFDLATDFGHHNLLFNMNSELAVAEEQKLTLKPQSAVIRAQKHG